MKKIIVFLLVGMFSASLAFANTYVRGYTKKNGTYVQPHYRSSPNSTRSDNWSTKGNVNPYTGKRGTKSPTYSQYGGSSGSGIFGQSGSGGIFGQY